MLLWRDRNLSAGLLIGISAIWFLFEIVEYNFVTLLCHLSIATMLVFFIWCYGAEIFRWYFLISISNYILNDRILLLNAIAVIKVLIIYGLQNHTKCELFTYISSGLLPKYQKSYYMNLHSKRLLRRFTEDSTAPCQSSLTLPVEEIYHTSSWYNNLAMHVFSSINFTNHTKID